MVTVMLEEVVKSILLQKDVLCIPVSARKAELPKLSLSRH